MPARQRDYSAADKNEEILWVLEKFRGLYSNYRNAERLVQIDEQNNRRGRETLNHIADFNRCQFQLEFALGVEMPLPKIQSAKSLHWVTYELNALRERALGEGEFLVKRPARKSSAFHARSRGNTGPRTNHLPPAPSTPKGETA